MAASPQENQQRAKLIEECAAKRVATHSSWQGGRGGGSNGGGGKVLRQPVIVACIVAASTLLPALPLLPAGCHCNRLQSQAIYKVPLPFPFPFPHSSLAVCSVLFACFVVAFTFFDWIKLLVNWFFVLPSREC